MDEATCPGTGKTETALLTTYFPFSSAQTLASQNLKHKISSDPCLCPSLSFVSFLLLHFYVDIWQTLKYPGPPIVPWFLPAHLKQLYDNKEATTRKTKNLFHFGYFPRPISHAQNLHSCKKLFVVGVTSGWTVGPAMCRFIVSQVMHAQQDWAMGK